MEISAPAVLMRSSVAYAALGATSDTLSLAGTIQPASNEDLDAIRHLLREVHFDTRHLQATHFVVARDDGGRVIGCAQIKPVGEGQVLSSVVVHPKWRSKGIGRCLIRSLLDRESGPVFLMCLGRLMLYYQAFGFARVMPRSAPPGLYWRWVALATLGWIVPGAAGAVVMARAAPSTR